MMKSVLFIFAAQCFYATVLATDSANLKITRLGTRSDDSLPPLVPPKFHDEEEFDERDLESNNIDGASNKNKELENYKMLLQMLANSQEENLEKRSMGMLRMGRSYNADDQLEDVKRTMGMLRMGRSMGMLRMGRSFDENKRSMGMLRMGRGSNLDNNEDDFADTGKRSMGMLRMGRSFENGVDKKSMGMLRMGKRSVESKN